VSALRWAVCGPAVIGSTAPGRHSRHAGRVRGYWPFVWPTGPGQRLVCGLVGGRRLAGVVERRARQPRRGCGERRGILGSRPGGTRGWAPLRLTGRRAPRRRGLPARRGHIGGRCQLAQCRGEAWRGQGGHQCAQPARGVGEAAGGRDGHDGLQQLDDQLWVDPGVRGERPCLPGQPQCGRAERPPVCDCGAIISSAGTDGLP